MTLKEFVNRIISANGQAYLVGGAVRDSMLGLTPHDHDYVVCGIDEPTFAKLFDNPNKTGKQFPVFRLEIEDEEVEVALARKEVKTSAGHNGFEMIFNKDITIEEDLIRRDVTMNSMAVSLIDNTLIDPFNGKADIENKIIRATSKHFLEDPLRILRVARQASKYNFTVSDDTYELMRQGKNELYTLPYSRIWGELEKALRTDNPTIFFEVLKKADVLDVILPELTDFDNTMSLLSKTPKDWAVRFASMLFYVDSDVIANFNPERFPAKLKKIAYTVAKHRTTKVVDAESILEVMSDLKKCNGIAVMNTILQSLDIDAEFLHEDFAKFVFDKVKIPDELLKENNGEKIKKFVTECRINRIIKKERE